MTEIHRGVRNFGTTFTCDELNYERERERERYKGLDPNLIVANLSKIICLDKIFGIKIKSRSQWFFYIIHKNS